MTGALVRGLPPFRPGFDCETDVLVVGSGNSGCDIAVDCAQLPRLATTISIRRGHLFQPKTFAGKPRGELWIMRLPPRLQDYALRTMIRIAVGRPGSASAADGNSSFFFSMNMAGSP